MGNMAGLHFGAILLFTVYLASLLTVAEFKNHKQYCIVGAGPAGLQMGYFLERAGRDYIIYERAKKAGWFFTKYPRHRTIISINKRYTGKTNKEFNLRHDWNSLISDDDSLLMKHYSKDFFPPADSLVKYLRDYAERLKLKIQYQTKIINISKLEDEDLFQLTDGNDTKYSCKVLIVSTGLWRESIPKSWSGLNYTVGYPSMSINPDDYEGKTILIVGRGNSAFETASHLLGAANFIHMMSRNRLRLSWETHYVGDVRAVNDGPIDTYQLKSLDGQFEGNIEDSDIKVVAGGRYLLGLPDGEEMPDNFAGREPYDVIIRCLGFKFDFDIFDKSIRPKTGARRKYPQINPNYESKKTPGLFFAGTVTHSLDWRKSSGGFIHGFRYTVRALFRLLEWRFQRIPWPSVTLPNTELLNHILKRLNEGSGSYQMFNNLADVVIFRDPGKFEYFEEFPNELLPEFEKHTGRPWTRGFVINLQYGQNFSGPGSDPFREDRAVGSPSEAHESNFLHPVMYYYSKPIEKMGPKGSLPTPNRIHHMVEDFLTAWDAPLNHHLPLRWFLENVAGEDLRNFYAPNCFEMMMTYKEVPASCKSHYLHGLGIPMPMDQNQGGVELPGVSSA